MACNFGSFLKLFLLKLPLVLAAAGLVGLREAQRIFKSSSNLLVPSSTHAQNHGTSKRNLLECVTECVNVCLHTFFLSLRDSKTIPFHKAPPCAIAVIPTRPPPQKTLFHDFSSVLLRVPVSCPKCIFAWRCDLDHGEGSVGEVGCDWPSRKYSQNVQINIFSRTRLIFVLYTSRWVYPTQNFEAETYRRSRN